MNHKRRLSFDNINEIFNRFERQNPSPVGELYYTSPFTLLIAVVLSAQATDKGVNRVTTHLFKFIQTPEDLINLGEDKLREAVRTIGLYKTKAYHLIKLANILKEKFNGHVPTDRQVLISLPGVGRKTANVILNTAFDQPTVAVDTHVFRVAHRLGLANGRTPLKVELELSECIPPPFLKNAHLWLVLHGRYICKARLPQCELCFLKDLCPYYHELT